MLRAHPYARHPSVTIGIGEINIPSDKHVLIIRAARGQNQYAENCDFNDIQDPANHVAIPNRQFKMRNPKFSPISLFAGWSPEYASMQSYLGLVAHRFGQGTANPVFAPRSTSASSDGCEGGRPRKNKHDRLMSRSVNGGNVVHAVIWSGNFVQPFP